MDWIRSKPKVKIEGAYSFHVQLSTQSLDSASTVTVTAFSDKNHIAALPCNYIWFSIKNGLAKQVTHYKGCSFVCDPSQIGSQIQTHIYSTDPQYPGKAIVTFPPVLIDPSLKTAVLNCLSARSLNIPVGFVKNNQEVEGMLHLFEAQLKLSHRFRDMSFLFDYSILEPHFLPHLKDKTRLMVSFSPKYEQELRAFQMHLFGIDAGKTKEIQLKFINKSDRDCFLFTLKAFLTKRQLRNMAVIKKMQSINFEKDDEFNAVMEVQTLRRDLTRFDQMYETVVYQKNRLQADINNGLNRTIRPDMDRENQQLASKVRELQHELQKSRLQSSFAHSSVSRQLGSPFKKEKEDNKGKSLVRMLDDLQSEHNSFVGVRDHKMESLISQNHQLTIRLERSSSVIKQLQHQLSKTQILPKTGATLPYQATIRKDNAASNIVFASPQGKPYHTAESPSQMIKFQSPVPNRKGGSMEGSTANELMNQRAHKQQLQVQLQRIGLAKQALQSKCAKLQRRVKELSLQLQIAKQNNDVMNRSQTISHKMDSFTDQQVRVLKQHNNFLVNENEKLVRSCERYMAEAKQNNRLRQEIIKLKQIISRKQQDSLYI